MKCPICRREYTICDGEVKPILFKVVFQNKIEGGLPHPYNLFAFTSRRHVNLDDYSGDYVINGEWFKKTKILFKIINEYFNSDKFFEPLILYMYKDENDYFTLKSNKPKNDYELLSINDFENDRQDEDIITKFVYLHRDVFLMYVTSN
jgi:hypothetical protein